MATNFRYFILANYSQKAIAGMVKAPSDRAVAVRKMCEAVGVKFVSLDLCRGVFDVVMVMEADCYDKALALKMAVMASGGAQRTAHPGAYRSLRCTQVRRRRCEVLHASRVEIPGSAQPRGSTASTVRVLLQQVAFAWSR